MSFNHFLHENILLPISDILTCQHVSRNLRFLCKADAWDKEQMIDFQVEKLNALVSYIAKEVPFYCDWFSRYGLNPEEIVTLEDLSKLPIVDKALMRKEGLERFSARCFPEKKRMTVRSSGSTGEPFSFLVSKESYSMNLAAKLRTWYQAGYRLGDRYMKIVYMPRQGWKKKLQDVMNNCSYIFFDSLSVENLCEINNMIETQKPLYIRSYPMPLFLLAKYRLQQTSYSHQPRHIMTTGAVLTSGERSVIERAFGCDVIDSYSCEGNPNSAETPEHDGYHTCDAYGIVEVLDENDIPVKNGIGRVVSTDFWNKAYPFVRYDTGDLVEVSDGVITRIIGRQSEAVTSMSGVVFSIYSFMSFFEHAMAVE